MEPIKVSTLFSRDWLNKLYTLYDEWEQISVLTGTKRWVYLPIDNDKGEGYEYLEDAYIVFSRKSETTGDRVIILGIPGGKYEKVVVKDWNPIQVDIDEPLQDSHSIWFE